MAKSGMTEINAQLVVLRRLARELVQASKGAKAADLKGMRALRQQQRRTVATISAEIELLKQLKRRVLRARFPDGLQERFLA